MRKKILIVEDEPIIADDLAYIIANFGYKITGNAMSVQEAINEIESELPDLVLIDIALKGDDDGVDLANIINKKYHIPFIFVTSNADLLTINRVKKANPSGFVLKPFREKELKIQLEIALFEDIAEKDNQKDVFQNDKIFVKVGSEMIGLKKTAILYAKADDNYTFLYTDQKEYCVSINLKKFILKLDSNVFLRVHRSYLINLKHIHKIAESYVSIDRYKIPIGRTYMKELKQRIQII